MLAVMTLCLLQIQTYKTRYWTTFLWIYVIAGCIVAIPLTAGQYLLESIGRFRRRWFDPAAL